MLQHRVQAGLKLALVRLQRQVLTYLDVYGATCGALIVALFAEALAGGAAAAALGTAASTAFCISCDTSREVAATHLTRRGASARSGNSRLGLQRLLLV